MSDQKADNSNSGSVPLAKDIRFDSFEFLYPHLSRLTLGDRYVLKLVLNIRSKMKIWVDDIRRPPTDNEWFWLNTSAAAIGFLMAAWRRDMTIDVMSLDHDLGGDDTTRPIVLWCCENDFWPDEVRVHSANPVGVEWLEGMIERYKP